MRPSGIRLGTAALTSRGMNEEDMQIIAKLIDQGVKLAVKVQTELPEKSMFKDFKAALASGKYKNEIDEIAGNVKNFAKEFPMPGRSYE